MGQISSQQQQSAKITKIPLSIFHNRKHNPYGQKINQSLKTEEDEKNFYEEYSIIKREDDIFLGDYIIMRENNSKLKVCVKEMAVQSRQYMRYIQQNLLNNFNCYNNEEEINESKANLTNACQNDVLSYYDIVAKREENNSSNNNNNKIKLMSNYHLNLISVVRVVKAKDELDFFLCNQNFRILYALEYSDLNLSNYFIDEKNSLNEQDIWQLIEQLTSALLFLQQQGKQHGNLTSRSIFIMPCSNYLHREQQQQQNDLQICECLLQFKWYKIVESELVRSQSMYERIFQDVFYNKINLKDNTYSQIIRGFYLSPEMIEEINQNKYKSYLDPYKADVFTLGCVILEAMSKSLRKYSLNVSLDGIFEYRQVNTHNKCLFNQDKLKSLIQTVSFSYVYSESLVNIIRTMVNFEYSKRPDFKELALMLQRIDKYHTPLNRQLLSKEIEAVSSFNMTKSVQLNTISSELAKSYEVLNNSQKTNQGQNMLDTLQQIQQKQQQASFQVETTNKNENQFKLNFNKNMFEDQNKKEEIITITPIQEVNYTQELMKLDVAEEDQQFLQNCLEQKQNDNHTKLFPQTQRNQIKNIVYASNSKVLNCMINKENKKMLDENDTTLGSLINKTSRNDLSSLNTSIIQGTKGSRRAILQENKYISNNQDLIKPISDSYQTERSAYTKQHNSFDKQVSQVQTKNKEVYDMIDNNYKKKLIDYQHKRSNSTYIQNQRIDQNNNLNFCYDLIKKYPLSNYDYYSKSSNKLAFNQHEEQNFQKRSQSFQKFNQQSETRDFDSVIIKDTDKFDYISNNSVIQQQLSIQNNVSTVIPQIKSQFKSYISSNSNEIGKNLENAIKQTNQILQNQRQQLIQYMQNNFNEPSNITSQKELKNDKNQPINTIPLPTDQGWKLQDSLPSHRSQSQKINNNSNNNQNRERLQSVHIENFDQSFHGSESQLSIRSYQTNKLNGTQQTICTPLVSTQTYLSNQYNSENANNSSKIDPKIYENSVKLNRNMSLSELRLIDQQQYKINKPNQCISNTSFNNNNSISSYLTPRELKSENIKQGLQELQFYQNQKLPLLKIDQIEEKQAQKIPLTNPIQIGQNTESILDCSLLNDNKNNSQMYNNQMQLFTYSTGTLPSSTRKGCKRRTQSSYINDTQYTNQNNIINLNCNLNSYLDSELTLNTLNNCELKVSNNQNSNKASLDQLQIQEAQSKNAIPFKNQSQKDASKNVSLQQKQQLNSLQLNSQRAHKFDLETVQELKESQFNQTTNISAKKLTCQSTQGFQIEGSNVLLTSFTPIKASQNLISNPNLQSQKKEKLSSSKIQENNLLSQHSPPQNNKIIAKRYLDKEEEEKFQKCSSVINIQKEYVYEKYEDGAYYEGENWGTLRWGLGKFVYADGACYEGEWKRGKMNGYGKLYYPSRQLAYEGKWKDDKFDGRGVIYNEKPILTSYGQEIDFQDFNKMSEEWTKFDGEFKIDEKSGFGTFYFSNSSKFQCNFVNDMAQGVGTFTLSDGKTQIIGEWKENILVNIYQQKQMNQ